MAFASLFLSLSLTSCSSPESDVSEAQEEFNNENIRKNILGAVAGFDVNLTNFVISGRVSFDFLTNNGDGTNTTLRYKNELVQLTVGFKL